MADYDSEALPAEQTATTSQHAVVGWRRKFLVPFASLENRNFRMLWFGQLGQGSAMWAEQIARNWLTWQLTESATALGLVNVFRALPLITLGLLGGAIADRFDKRKVLIIIQFWSLSIYIAMAVLILGDWIKLWHVYLTAFLLGGGMAMNQPIRSSFIPQLLERRLLINALSLNSIAMNFSRLGGPAMIGYIIALSNDNVGPAYVIGASIYLLVILSTFMLNPPARQARERSVSIGRDVIEGLRYMLLENRTVLALIIVAMGPMAFAFNYITLLPVFVTQVLNMGSSGFGTIQSIAAVGALIGGFILASRANVRHKGRLILGTGLTFGFAVMLMSVLRTPLLVFALMPVMGACQAIFRAAHHGTLLEISPEQYRGRVMSMTFLDRGVQSLTAILAGAVTDIWDVSVGLVVIGAMCVAIVALMGLAVPTIRRL